MSGAQEALTEAVLAVLRESDAVQAAFGDPARVFDGPPRRAPFPYLSLERHEVSDDGGEGVVRTEHRVTLVITARRGGRRETGRLVDLVDGVLRGARLAPLDHRVVLALPVFRDVLQARDGASFRGVLRLRAIMDKEESA